MPLAHMRRRVPLISVTQLRSLSESARVDSEEWIEFPKEKQGPRTVALRVSGESMEPDYKHGDLIYIDPDAVPLHGKDVIVRFPDSNEVTFKRLVLESDRRSPIGEPSHFPEDTFHFVGARPETTRKMEMYTSSRHPGNFPML